MNNSVEAPKPSIKDRLTGNTLRVPNESGHEERVRATTLRRSLVGPRKRTVFNVSDYGGNDLAFAEVGIRIDQIDKRGKIRRIQEVPVDPFSTVSTGFLIEQIGLHGNNTDGTIIFSNTAPRGGKNTGEVVWEGENDKEEHRFVFGLLENGVPVLAVNTGHNLSFIKARLSGLWVANVSNNGTQFRSRDNYPQSLEILRGRRGRHLIGERLDPKTIPDAPGLTIAEDGKVKLPVVYIDGYGNLKTGIKKADLPKSVMERPELTLVRLGTHHIVKNTLAGAKAENGDFFLTEGSSGERESPYIELNKMHGRSADSLGFERVTDDTKIVLEAA